MFESARIWVESDARNRPRPHTFYPPKDNRLVCWLSKQIAARSVRDKLKVVDVSISDDDLARLRDLRGQRCLLMPSHSGGFEPYVIMDLTRKLDVNCYYLAAIEAFERNPLIGWFMQRSGAYSIIRGTADRLSFQMTRKVLAECRRWLVVFPEGQTVWQNDTVIPFQEGVTQLAFKGYEDATKADPDASLVCVPIAIKYLYVENMDEEIDASLTRLEEQLLAQDADVSGPPVKRLRRLSDAVLTANEKKHGVTPDSGSSLDTRIQCMKETIVRDIENQLEITPRADLELIDRIRGCFNAVDAIVNGPAESLPYEEKLMQERRNAASDLYEDLWRILQFVAIYEGYVRELSTVERFMDVLCILEMEVFGKRHMWGPRRAVIKVGAPVDLRDHADTYRDAKRATVHKISLGLETQVSDMLQALARAHSTALQSAI
jgi:1-acyl-sn-glycerol-3-phosphate acyltransferase